MTVILVIIGAIIGASYAEYFGFVAGAVLGYLLGTVIQLREQFNRLQRARESTERGHISILFG